jgi:SAM-dependent methyltransferase
MTTPLDDLARGAEAHARQEHGLTIGLDAVDRVDEILKAEAGRADPARLESLAACYGAWLGRLAALRWKAVWIGLSEPVAPRLRLGGIVVSPIDAVRRRLQDPGAPDLGKILQEIEQGSRGGETARADALAANRGAWDALADDPRFAGPAGLPRDPAAARDALDDWIRSEGIEGKDLLCLGAGGGRQGPLHALAGARVTVVDLSDRQLDQDRRGAEALGVKLRTVRSSLDRLEALQNSSFDLVLQPVSACYLPEVGPVFAEVARVIRPGGLYMVQHKQPASLQAAAAPGELRIVHPCAEGTTVPPQEAGTREFLHTLEALLGGVCRAGFVIEDVAEPPRADALAPPGSAGHRAWFLPPYLRVKARRRS